MTTVMMSPNSELTLGNSNFLSDQFIHFFLKKKIQLLFLNLFLILSTSFFLIIFLITLFYWNIQQKYEATHVKEPSEICLCKGLWSHCSEGHCPAVIWLSPINRPRCGVDGSRYFPGSICPWVALWFSCYPQSSPLSTFLFLKNWGIPGRKKTKVKRLRFRQSEAG